MLPVTPQEIVARAPKRITYGLYNMRFQLLPVVADSCAYLKPAVRVEGFEPPLSWSQTKRFAKLSYTRLDPTVSTEHGPRKARVFGVVGCALSGSDAPLNVSYPPKGKRMNSASRFSDGRPIGTTEYLGFLYSFRRIENLGVPVES